MSDIILEPPVEFWNVDTQFGRASSYINHPANLPTYTAYGYILSDTKQKNYCTTINQHTSKLQHHTCAHTYHKIYQEWS